MLCLSAKIRQIFLADVQASDPGLLSADICKFTDSTIRENVVRMFLTELYATDLFERLSALLVRMSALFGRMDHDIADRGICN